MKASLLLQILTVLLPDSKRNNLRSRLESDLLAMAKTYDEKKQTTTSKIYI